MLRFAALSTPTEDGQTLVEPKVESLAGLVERNHRLLSESRCEILGEPLSELRKRTRSALLGQPSDQPVVVTGHQPEFYHAGVWAKNFVASRLAAAVGGRAANLIVDNDSPKKTSIMVPHHCGGVLTAYEVPFGEYHAGWAFEQLPAIPPEVGRRVLNEVREALGEEAYQASAMPLMEPALTGQNLTMGVIAVREESIGGRASCPPAGGTPTPHFLAPVPAEDFVNQVTLARKSVEAVFGLDLIELRVSVCWAGPMLIDMILNAGRFAECYNAALAEYRKAAGIRGTKRPAPDLLRDAGRIELPVWVYRQGQTRRRLFVETGGGTITFSADDVRLACLSLDHLRRADGPARLLEATGWLFRPRALTLTLWARLLLADLFIHGIGGAKYDRITDRLMQLYFGIEPPAMACVSATVRMPMERFPVAKADLWNARHKARDVHYNPQRYVSAIAADLSERLQRRVDGIAESQRLAREDRGNQRARRDAFRAIRQANADLLAADPLLPDRLAAQVHRIEHQLAHNAVADSREYFFGLLPMTKLKQLADALPTTDRLRAT